MSEVLHANIFFFIASVATVVFCVFVCFVLYHVYKITRAIRRIVERIEAGSEVIADDVAFVRGLARGGIAKLFGIFTGGGDRARSRSRSRRAESNAADTDGDGGDAGGD
jgi:hypothetical protein